MLNNMLWCNKAMVTGLTLLVTYSAAFIYLFLHQSILIVDALVLIVSKILKSICDVLSHIFNVL